MYHKITMVAMAVAGLMTAISVKADNGYYSNQTVNNYPPYANAGYHSSAQPLYQPDFSGSFSHHKHDASNHVVATDAYIVPDHHRKHSHHGIQWISMTAGVPLPAMVVMGGGEAGKTYPICRSNYQGNTYPGKVIKERCHITWDGHEISLGDYQVLTSKRRPGSLSWVPGNEGYAPLGAIYAGYENQQPLYICQAAWKGGIHPGKLVGNLCHIAWHGQELAITQYNLLVAS